MEKEMENALSQINQAAEFVLKLAKTTDFQVEIFGSYSESNSLTMEKKVIDQISNHTDQGIGIRIISKKKMGFSHTDKFTPQSLERAFNNALGIWKSSKEYERLDIGLGTFGKSDVVNKDYFDEEILGLDLDDKIAQLSKIKDPMEEKIRGKSLTLGGELNSSVSALVIASSEGTLKQGISSVYSYFIQSWIKEGDSCATAYDYNFFSNLSSFSPDLIGANLADKVLSFLNPIRIKTKIMDLIFSNEAAFDLLNSVATASSANLWIKEQTYFQGRLNKLVSSPFLTLFDNGLLSTGLSFPFDDEGAPRSRTCLVKEGILTNLLTDRYSANILGLTNTGNASRAGYTSLPTIKETNLELEWAGEIISKEELINEIKNGIYIDSGDVIPDLVSGEVSGSVDFGYKIKNGEIQAPIKDAIIGQFGFQLLTNISAISKERQRIGGSDLPCLKIEKIKIKAERD